MLHGKGQRLNLQEISFTQQANRINTKGVSGQFGLEAGAYTRSAHFIQSFDWADYSKTKAAVQHQFLGVFDRVALMAGDNFNCWGGITLPLQEKERKAGCYS